MAREVKIGQVYRHFKGRHYVVLDVVRDSEDDEGRVVIYQALYGARERWARPLAMFLSEVDHEKYPEVEQRWRFEEVEV